MNYYILETSLCIFVETSWKIVILKYKHQQMLLLSQKFKINSKLKKLILINNSNLFNNNNNCISSNNNNFSNNNNIFNNNKKWIILTLIMINNLVDLNHKSLRIGQQVKCISNHKDRKCYNISRIKINNSNNNKQKKFRKNY